MAQNDSDFVEIDVPADQVDYYKSQGGQVVGQSAPASGPAPAAIAAGTAASALAAHRWMQQRNRYQALGGTIKNELARDRGPVGAGIRVAKSFFKGQAPAQAEATAVRPAGGSRALPKHLVKLTAEDAANPAFAPRKAGTIIRRTTYDRIGSAAEATAPGPKPRPAGPKPNPAAVANPKPAAKPSNVISMPGHGEATGPELAQRYRGLGPASQAVARRVNPPAGLPKGVPLEPENPNYAAQPGRGVGPVGIGPAMNAIMMLLNIATMPQQMRDSDQLFKEMNRKRLGMPYVPPPEPA